MSRFVVVACAGWVVMLSLLVTVFLFARQAAMTTYGSAETQAHWDAWRLEALEQSRGAGPVKRSVPKSDEPPALVLMRDYFGVSLGASLVLATSVYFSFAWFLRGALGLATDIPTPPSSAPK